VLSNLPVISLSPGIFRILVLIRLYLGCRNKSSEGAFGIGWAGFGFGGGAFLNI
jgi:hypothetical protein